MSTPSPSGNVRTLALTDEYPTAEADNGQVRYPAQDRYCVFLVEATDDDGSISSGMYAIMVPRALSVESKLKVRIDDGITYPPPGLHGVLHRGHGRGRDKRGRDRRDGR